MKKTHHDNNGRFFNPWTQKRRHPYLKLIKWLVFSRNRFRAEKKEPVSFKVLRPDFNTPNSSGGDCITWLGHSTVLMRLAGKVLITDPVFWDVNLLVRRKTPAPVDPRELPPIDYVLISHSHYDHLNTKSVKFLKKAFDPVFITGPGYEGYFKSIGVSKHLVLDWKEEFRAGNIRIVSLPVQHWSKRTLFDTDKMLWCSYLIERGETKYYWIGDTGYYEGYKEIGERWGPIDVLMVPVGAYEPRWFMKNHHVNPEEALMIASDVRARLMIPIHWGTFDLTDEPLSLPIKHLREIHDGGKDPALVILDHGGTFDCSYLKGL
ncbi:MAG: MBL fold metallo-hydrolase [Deltaproteobacteria bacterium]|nr:MBL fold metallo-hydrolase [Deltaproteobacteria bacterium]